MKAPPLYAGHWLWGALPDLRRDPGGTLLRAAREHGDVVRMRFGPVRAWSIRNPDDVQHVLLDNHRAYTKRTRSYGLLATMFGKGLVTSDGDHWLRQRRLIQPLFHRDRITGFTTIMADAAEAMAAQWQHGDELELIEELSRLTLQIVGRCLFERDLDTHASEIGAAVALGNDHLARALYDPFSPPLTIPTPANLRYRAARRTMDRVVRDMIAARRARASESADLLSMLMAARDESGDGMSDTQVRDEAVTLLIAGHETTAVAITWSLVLLARHPEVAARLSHELAALGEGRPSIADLRKAPLLERVVLEAMRLYPPAANLERLCAEGDTLGGYSVPAKTLVLISPWVIHRHPGLWPDPDVFDPDRFLPELVAARHRFAYVPFLMGPRKCIADQFAVLETQIVLAAILRRFRVELAPEQDVEPGVFMTLRPRNGVRVILSSVAA